jgi:hypothetical protein
MTAGCPERQRGGAVNAMAKSFVGSSPTPGHQLQFMGLARLKTEGEPYYEDPLDDLLVEASERYGFGLVDWRGVFGSYPLKATAHPIELGAPHVWVPRPALLVAATAALTIVRNPVVTRRFWQGWLR